MRARILATMKIAAAYALAGLVETISPGRIIPKPSTHGWALLWLPPWLKRRGAQAWRGSNGAPARLIQSEQQGIAA